MKRNIEYFARTKQCKSFRAYCAKSWQGKTLQPFFIKKFKKEDSLLSFDATEIFN